MPLDDRPRHRQAETEAAGLPFPGNLQPLGWRFTLANILLGLLMVLYAYGITALWFPSRLAEEGRRHAEKAQKAEGMDMEHGMDGNWRD